MTLLSAENHKSGLLVNEAHCAGVIPLDSGQFAAFVTEIETARTVHYLEFPTLDEALRHVNERLAAPTPWHFEAFGCDKGASCKGAQKGACPGCANNQHADC